MAAIRSATEVNEAFHATIYTGAHNSYLAEMTHATRTRVQPFRRAQFRNLGRLAKSHLEHDRVVIAILRGDREGAAAAMRLHIMTVCEAYEATGADVRSSGFAVPASRCGEWTRSSSAAS